MNYVVDPTFSVYRLVERMQNLSVVMNQRRTMSLISYEIENASIIDGAHTRIFSGFQYMSRFLRQQRRYQKLAARAESIYVFGVPDVEPPAIENVFYIHLSPTDRLTKEWFLISFGAEFCSALATEEISTITDPDDQRVFKGIWTSDADHVVILHDWLTSAVDARPLLLEARDYRKQVDLMSHSLRRLTDAINQMNEQAARRKIEQALRDASQSEN